MIFAQVKITSRLTVSNHYEVLFDALHYVLCSHVF